MKHLTLLGPELLRAARTAQSSAAFVSPFVKAEALRSLIKALPHDVPLSLVTRWRLPELASGVTDLEAWEIVSSRPHSRMLLHNEVHAKFYRLGESVYAGSANLTQQGLGWAEKSNRELSVAYSSTPESEEFERVTMAESLVVDQLVFELARKALDEWRRCSSAGKWLEPISLGFSQPCAHWIPTLRDPSLLYSVYLQADGHTEAIVSSARRDLAALGVPSGLEKPAFDAFVSTALIQTPTVARVDRFLSEPRRFGAVADFLRSHVSFDGEDPAEEADIAWQTLMRWLLYVHPQRYYLTVPRHSEVVGKHTSPPAQGASSSRQSERRTRE